MDKHSEKYQTFQKLLKKWRDGTIRAHEEAVMHAMVKEDPFLADAWEGFQVEGNHDDALERLQKRILKPEKVKRRALVWYSRAAAVFILAIAGLWFLWPKNPDYTQLAQLNEPKEESQVEKLNPNQNIVKNDLPAPSGDEEMETMQVDAEEELMVDQSIKSNAFQTNGATAESMAKAAVDDIENAPLKVLEETEILAVGESDIEKQDEYSHTTEYGSGAMTDSLGSEFTGYTAAEISDSSDSSVPSNSSDSLDSLAMESTGDVANETKSNYSVDDGQKNSDSAGVVSRPIVTADLPYEIETANMMSQIDLRQTIIGVVKDEYGEPLIGANILDLSSNKGTITDLDGRFSIKIPDDKSELEISYTGYESKRIENALGGQEIEVLMQEGAMLDEVVVMELQKKRSTASTTASKAAPVNGAVPKKGRENFEKRLRKVLATTENYAGYSSLTGELKLQLQLDERGKVIDFSIVQNLDPAIEIKAIETLIRKIGWLSNPVRTAGTYSYEIQY